MKKIFLLLLLLFNFDISFAENKLAYININHIINNSIVGQSISEHIQNIKQKQIDEFKIVEKKLATKEQDLFKKKNIIEKDEFEKQADILKKEILNYGKEKKKFNDEIEKKKIKYTKKILDALNPIVSSYVEKNEILIVFSKTNIVIAKKNLDITIPVMNLLNDQLSKIDF